MRQLRRCYDFGWGTSVWHVSTSLVIRPRPSLRCESGTWWLVMVTIQHSSHSLTWPLVSWGPTSTHSSSWPPAARCDGSRSDPRVMATLYLMAWARCRVVQYWIHMSTLEIFIHFLTPAGFSFFCYIFVTFYIYRNSFFLASLTWIRMSAQTPTVHCAGCNLEQMWSGDVRLSDVMSDARRGG